MILGDVEQCRSVRLEAAHAIELEARQLQHPDLRQGFGVEGVGERLQHRRADIAGHRHAGTGAGDKLRRHHGGRRLAVGAGDRQQLRRVAARLAKLREGADEQIELAAHRHAACRRRGQQLGDARVVFRTLLRVAALAAGIALGVVVGINAAHPSVAGRSAGRSAPAPGFSESG